MNDIDTEDLMKIVENSGVFSTKIEASQFFILDSMMQQSAPVGSWVLKAKLALMGLDLSTATIGRFLKELDSKGYSCLLNKQGRVLTDEGRKYVLSIRDEIERMQVQNDILQAMQTRNYHELIDLLNVRNLLETESARLAAIRATDKQIRMIRQTLKAHKDCVDRGLDPTSTALEFHKAVVAASNNKSLYATISLLIFEETKIESSFSHLVTRERGAQYAPEHEEICNAIAAHDAERAETLMNEHIKVLLDAVQEQSKEVEKMFRKQER